MDIINNFTLIELILFIIPGFISLSIWKLIIPTKLDKFSDNIIEMFSYSCLNYALFSWLIIIMYKNIQFFVKELWLSIILAFIMLFIGPIFWPLIILQIRKSKFFQEKCLIPTPTPWDNFFSRREGVFVLVHLNNGKKIGGLYSDNSSASSYPDKEEIYIEEVWDIDDKGKIIAKINGTKGMWIDNKSFDYIEFFNIEH